MKKCILIIGIRRSCYQAALDLGYDVILWSDNPLPKKRREGIAGWIEEPYSENSNKLSFSVINELAKYKVNRVIASTERAVLLAAMVRTHLKLKSLAVEVTERFRNKFIMKNCARDLGITVTDYKLIDKDTTATHLVDELKLPLVIKPVDEAGARDVVVARTLLDVERAMSPGLLAEAFVSGAEVSVETFVENGEPVFHNMTEYLHQWRKSAVPANIAPDLYEQIIKINNAVIKGFGVDRGMTHAEFYLTVDGPVFGEIAIRPPGGYYMELMKRVYNFDPWKMFVSLSCGDEVSSEPNTAEGCAAVFMVHPGAGEILSISGIEHVKSKLAHIFDFSLRKKVGDQIMAHESTSNETGHILFWAETRDQLDSEILIIEENLKIEMKA